MRPHDPDATTAGRLPPSAARALLAVWSGGSTTLPLAVHGSVVFGRGRDVDLTIPHASVSRRHAVLHLGVPMRIEDLGSANGTRVDGVALLPSKPVPILQGSIVEIGEARIVLCPLPPVGPPPMARVRAELARLVPSDISVVLVGETGAGKEVLADLIHQQSPRAAGPLFKLNCAALPENLLESELFGYERGAFTGAHVAKPGLLEAAGRGTMMLDEVGEMPLATQVKFLRVLENREILRLGSLRPRSIDVRFIAATHRDLDVLVVMGKFRQDLLFRLNGITIHVPPLRDRVDEIPDIAKALLARACEHAGRPPLRLSADAVALLSAYRWPGNVRELGNVMARALLTCMGSDILPEHLSFGRAAAPEQETGAASPAGRADDDSSEAARISAVLQEHGGNQTEAARALGITRRMLMYRLDKLGLARPRKTR